MKAYNEIKDLIAATENPVDIAAELRKLLVDAKAKIDTHQKAVAQRQAEEKIKALKALKPQSPVYSRELGSLFGKKLFKIKDGKTRMVVSGPTGKWRVPYHFLQDHPLNEMELRIGKIMS